MARLRFDNSGANDWEDVAVGPGNRAWGLGFGVQGLRFRVWGFGFKV